MQLSIFDLDRTLLKVNISFKFYFYLYRKNIFKKKSIFQQIIFFLKYKYFNLSLKDLHNLVFETILKNKPIAELTQHIDAFLDKYLDKFFYEPAVLNMQKAMQNNHYIVLLSSSPVFLVEPIAKILKIDEYRATTYLLDSENKLIKIDMIMNGKKKAKCAQQIIEKFKIPKTNITVYSDSIDDLALFQVAENKICVNPCRKLNQVVKENNWKII